MKIKRVYLIIGIAVLLLILGFIFFRFIIGGNEDTWIKDEKGVYVKHGNPSETPGYVVWQQAAISCAYDKFDNLPEEANSQCLGTCGNYAIDIVHVPRNEEDNLAENQCGEYGKGIVSNFIELDKNREIVRIV
jgi:hypothetical protein